MKAYKAVLYDLDGTLINTLDMNMYPLLRIIEEELGETWEFQDVVRFYAHPGLRTLKELGITDIEGAYARWVRYVNEYEQGAVPFAGVKEVLSAFQRAGIRQGAVSSKMHRQYQIDILDNGLGDFLETAVLVEDTVHHKPHPEPILEALKRLGLAAEDVIYVGDSLTDMEAARNAGVEFGFAAWGAVTKEGFEAADCRFEQPQDMLQLLPPKGSSL